MKFALSAIVTMILTAAISVFGQESQLEPAASFQPGYFDDQTYIELAGKIRKTHEANKGIVLPEAEAQQCSNAYGKLFATESLKISIFYGYGNLESEKDFTSDIAESLYLEKQLTLPCADDGIFICGFQAEASEGDAEVFSKKLTTSFGKQVAVKMRIFHSSLTENGALNVGAKKAEQHEYSAKIEAAYIDSLKTDDVVLYDGHARFGAGVGFSPVPLPSKEWFKTYLKRYMLHRMLSALSNSATQPKVIGMFMCDAEIQYGRKLSTAAPNTGLFLTRETMMGVDNMNALYVGLNGILGQTCEAELKQQLIPTTTRFYYRKGETLPTDKTLFYPKFFNFFSPEKITLKESPKYRYDYIFGDWEHYDLPPETEEKQE